MASPGIIYIYKSRGTSIWFLRWLRGASQVGGAMPTRPKKHGPTDWQFTMEQIGRELGKIYRRPGQLPPRLRAVVMQLERKVPVRRGRQWGKYNN